MTSSTPLRRQFDEQSVKYRHWCVHIRVATAAVCVLQLLLVVYIISDYIVRSVITESAKNAHDHSGDTAAGKWLHTRGAMPLFTWALFHTIFVSLVFYGLSKNQPWPLAPQLFLQCATAVACGILVILIACLLTSTGVKYTKDTWYYLALVCVVLLLHAYGSFVMARAYLYLRDKYAYTNQVDDRRMYVLPMRAGDLLINREYGGVAVGEVSHADAFLYEDTPPAYPAVVAAVDEQGVDKSSLPPPTYEEARLRRFK